ncbi:MAG: hypothetical protein HWN81_02540 [Candidatus Lokiarchaeota archaeon]|nr:hypothetical protein [Candidatus Lokiarchaeota archaeon]
MDNKILKKESKPQETVQKNEVEKSKEIGDIKNESKELKHLLSNKIESKKTIKQKQAQIKRKIEKQEAQESDKNSEPEFIKRYRQETGKRPFYRGEKTKGFLEWLKKQKEKEEEQQEEISEKSGEVQGNDEHEWTSLLEEWINRQDISEEIKTELLEKLKKYYKYREYYRLRNHLIEKFHERHQENVQDPYQYTNKEKELLELIINLTKKLNQIKPVENTLFQKFKKFRDFYNKSHKTHKEKIKAQEKQFIRHLAELYENFQLIWKELLNKNLYKSTEMTLKEKSKVRKIIEKEILTEEEQKELISILSKLPSEELNILLGLKYKLHTQNYVKWGRDYDIGVKKLMLNKHLKRNITLSQKLLNTKRENPLNFTKQEFDFFNKYNLEFKRFESRWVWMELYPDLIPIFFKEFLFPIYNRDPSVRELYNLGFGNFSNKLKKVLGMPYGQWKEEQGYYDFKKCTRCGNFLPNEKFERLRGHEEQKRGAYRSMCINCRNDVRRISIYNKKYRLIKDYLGGKCHDCGEDLTVLDGYEFHHLYPELKTATWREMKEKSYKEIVQWAFNDRIIPLCGNCHAKRTATVFSLQKELILLEKIFSFSPLDIDNLISEKIKEQIDQMRSGKNQIKKWIRKRFIYTELFFGKCIGCGKITVYNNLPALQLHHLFPELLEVKNKWYDLADFDCEIIMDIIIKERCVGICSNCHSVIGSRFQEVVEEIVNDSEFISHVKIKYKTITERINAFRIDMKKINFRSPLKLPITEEYIEKAISTIFKNLDLNIHQLEKEYLNKLKNRCYEILQQIPLEDRSLRDPYVLSGVTIYLADRLIAIESGFKPFLTQNLISKILNIDRSNFSDIYNNFLTPKFLNTKQIEYDRIIEYLKIQGKASRQEIGNLIGRSLKPTYRRLLELEKLGLIKRERNNPISNISGKGSSYTYWLIA